MAGDLPGTLRCSENLGPGAGWCHRNGRSPARPRSWPILRLGGMGLSWPWMSCSPRHVAFALGSLLLALAARGAETRAEPADGGRPAAQQSSPRETRIDLQSFRRYESGSGWGYYRLMENGAFIRGTYPPGSDTVSLGTEVPEPLRSKARKLRWRWRVLSFPEKGDECKSGVQDSAAVVYLTYKSGLNWRVIKYVWSTVGRLNATCDRKSFLFAAQETVILESGGATGAWREEEIDLRAAYRQHFAGGDPRASVPDFVGIGLLTDGDATRSPSSADYADFTVVY